MAHTVTVTVPIELHPIQPKGEPVYMWGVGVSVPGHRGGQSFNTLGEALDAIKATLELVPEARVSLRRFKSWY